jgi:hypothetical protein
MAKLIGRQPVEIKLTDLKSGYAPVYDSASRAWTTVDLTGISSGSLSGSLDGTASYAITASHALSYSGTSGTSGTSPTITGTANYLAKFGAGANSLENSIVLDTGSALFVSGSVNITGSLLVSGSTTQVGNNTLLGNTTLSGSLVISGALGTNDPTIRIYGDTEHNGYIRFDPVNTNIDQNISASYIYVSGSTQDLYFSQNGNGYNNTTRLRWLEGNLYTGLLHGGLVTSQSATMYQISSGSGIIVNLNASLNDNPYPIIQYLSLIHI